VAAGEEADEDEVGEAGEEEEGTGGEEEGVGGEEDGGGVVVEEDGGGGVPTEPVEDDDIGLQPDACVFVAADANALARFTPLICCAAPL